MSYAHECTGSTRLLQDCLGNAIQPLEHGPNDVAVPTDHDGLPLLKFWHHALPPEEPRACLGIFQGFRVRASAPRRRDVIYE